MAPSSFLLIGDPHVVVDEFEDCRGLVAGIREAIRASNPNYVVFLGDQHHSFALVHVDVLGFWKETFEDLKREFPNTTFVALVGNHDQAGDGVSKNHALLAYKYLQSPVWVIDKPTSMQFVPVLFLPYFHNGEEFRKAVLAHPKAKLVLCHQTLVGARYENGFIARDGTSLEGLEGRQFVSGHIHTPQRYDNVIYVGAPRWRSMDDANVERGLTYCTLSEDGQFQIERIFDTSQYCRKLIHAIDRQDKPYTQELNPAWRYVVDLHGDQDYIQARKGFWAGQRIRTFRTQEVVKPVRESMGINSALSVFLDSYKPKHGTTVAILKEMAAERLTS